MSVHLQLPAPAKLNLFLHIIGRRQDGYHQLQTLFQLLDFGDILHFSSRSDGVITLTTTLSDVPAADNLVYRAAQLLQQHSGSWFGADITLDKRLPVGGGLGGGSSDAATTLLGLNWLWQTGLNIDELAVLGLRLGADVPVFIRGHTAWAEGIGEQLLAVSLPTPYYLVIHPAVSVSTARVFGDINLTRNSQAITLAAFLNQGGRNDCESVVRDAYSAVNLAFEWLSRFAKPQLTGTGACLFATFPDKESAETILAQLPPPWQGFVAQGVNQSALHVKLGITSLQS